MPPLRYGEIDPNTVEATREGCHTTEHLAQIAGHITRHGVKNPILVWARDGRQIVQSGNTRVFACRELGRLVPALIADWDNQYPHFKEIRGARQVRQLFPSGLRYLGLSGDTVTLAPFKIPLDE